MIWNGGIEKGVVRKMREHRMGAWDKMRGALMKGRGRNGHNGKYKMA